MEIRKCPLCGSTWHSAVSEGVWICNKCGAKIPQNDANPKNYINQCWK